MTDGPWLELRSVTKSFDGVRAVEDVSLSIERGEFLTLLGASGCGKSTTLRMIAGLEQNDGGEIFLAGRAIHDLPVHRRETAMVFQSYALFPHLTVEQNVAFGLEARHLPRATIIDKVARAIALVELDGFGKRYPRQLSGGQQQRVALARALVTEPKALLLDEPLSNLDAKLRDRLRLELRALQKSLGVTTIYVTHDQSEAMSLSDRVAFMAGGRIVEVGAPQEIYRRPRNRATADFLGVANLIEGRVVGFDGAVAVVETPAGQVLADTSDVLAMGEAVLVCLRPEDMALSPFNTEAGLMGIVTHVAYMGALTDYLVQTRELSPLRLHVPGVPQFAVGGKVRVLLPKMAAVNANPKGQP